MAIPKGAVPAYSLYGRPVNESRLNMASDVRLAAPSAEYVGRGNKCSANEDTCEAIRAKGTQFCAGHLRSKLKNMETQDGANATNEG